MELIECNNLLNDKNTIYKFNEYNIYYELQMNQSDYLIKKNQYISNIDQINSDVNQCDKAYNLINITIEKNNINQKK